MIYACVEYVFKNDVFVAILLYVIVFYYIQNNNKPHTVKLKDNNLPHFFLFSNGSCACPKFGFWKFHNGLGLNETL